MSDADLAHHHANIVSDVGDRTRITQLEAELVDFKRLLAEKNETANVFMGQVKKLQEEKAALELSHEHDHAGITAYSKALFDREDVGYTDGVRVIEKLKEPEKFTLVLSAMFRKESVFFQLAGFDWFPVDALTCTRGKFMVRSTVGAWYECRDLNDLHFRETLDAECSRLREQVKWHEMPTDQKIDKALDAAKDGE